MSRDFGWFLLWTVVGAAYGLAVAGALTIGIFVLPVAVITTIVLARQRRSHRGLAGLLGGPGVILAYIAYLNRGGPGEACVATAQSLTCTERSSPWPFLVSALILVLGSLALFAVLRRRDRRRTTGRARAVT
jgi:hypothetical protein